MNIIYNTQQEIATIIIEFLLKVDPTIRKTQLKIIPYIIIGMILSESSVKLDIAKKLKDDFSIVKLSSVTKRIYRFFKNKLFNPYSFYDKVIRYVISNYKKKHIGDSRVHITFDHMFSHNNFTVFMISMRIGSGGIPLWFRCFKGHDDSQAFQEQLLKDGISYVSSLFDKSFDLIFLADRWFSSTTLMEHIDSLGHTFCIRIKSDIKTLAFDKKEGHDIWTTTGNLFAYQCKSNFFDNAKITRNQYQVNLAISKKKGVSEHWIIATNGNSRRAIKDYDYRFGSIESIFKNQKSNGFYMEDVCNASLEYFTSLYSTLCFATLFLVILGSDYAKNTKCYKKNKIDTHTTINGKKVRIMSLFNTGLTLFNMAYNSCVYIRIPHKLILYDS